MQLLLSPDEVGIVEVPRTIKIATVNWKFSMIVLRIIRLPPYARKFEILYFIATLVK